MYMFTVLHLLAYKINLINNWFHRCTDAPENIKLPKIDIHITNTKKLNRNLSNK